MPKENEEVPPTPFEREQEKQLAQTTKEFSKIVDKVLTPIYAVQNFCFPATILLFAIQQIMRSCGYSGFISNWEATIFLWGPPLAIVAFVAVVVLALYAISLLAAFHKFVCDTIRYFSLWFKFSNQKK